MNKSDWFTDWFNTSYYHTLYKDRNDKDAQLFMRNIINFLKIPSSSHLLDLPCGKGRHSIYLIGRKYLDHLIENGKFEEIGPLYQRIFKNEKRLWEEEITRLILLHKVDAI